MTYMALTLIERGSWMLLESGGGLNQPAPSGSPQNTVKNQKIILSNEKESYGEKKFSKARSLNEEGRFYVDIANATNTLST